MAGKKEARIISTTVIKKRVRMVPKMTVGFNINVGRMRNAIPSRTPIPAGAKKAATPINDAA